MYDMQSDPRGAASADVQKLADEPFHRDPDDHVDNTELEQQQRGFNRVR